MAREVELHLCDSTSALGTHPTGAVAGPGQGEADMMQGTGAFELELVEGTFEACVEHRGPDADAPCTECGWLVADHTAGLAVVIEVGQVTAPALRRAS